MNRWRAFVVMIGLLIAGIVWASLSATIPAVVSLVGAMIVCALIDTSAPRKPLEEAWVVYEDTTGQAYTVTPPTRARALREARAAGIGHRAVTARAARDMRNAWAHGRQSEIENRRNA